MRIRFKRGILQQVTINREMALAIGVINIGEAIAIIVFTIVTYFLAITFNIQQCTNKSKSNQLYILSQSIH